MSRMQLSHDLDFRLPLHLHPFRSLSYVRGSTEGLSGVEKFHAEACTRLHAGSRRSGV
jgi:hypothetical protein